MHELTSDLPADLSAGQPVGSASPKQWTEEWWAQAKPEVQFRRCKAHRKNGDRCKHASLNGQRVCAYHGGKARQSVEAARRRLMENADPAVKQLTEIAYDETKSDDIRLKATLALIDRAGLSPKTAVEVEVTAKPYEVLFETVELGGSRAEYRRSIGIEEEDVLGPFEADGVDLASHLGIEAADDNEVVIDAEVDYLIPNQPLDDDDERGSPFDSEALPSPFGPTPGKALVPFDEAVSKAAILRRAHRM
jgi:hypothetical protein